MTILYPSTPFSHTYQSTIRRYTRYISMYKFLFIRDIHSLLSIQSLPLHDDTDFLILRPMVVLNYFFSSFEILRTISITNRQEYFLYVKDTQYDRWITGFCQFSSVFVYFLKGIQFKGYDVQKLTTRNVPFFNEG